MQSYFNYFLAYVAEDENDSIGYCQSNEDAITVHPVDATWTCKDGFGSFLLGFHAFVSGFKLSLCACLVDDLHLCAVVLGM